MPEPDWLRKGWNHVWLPYAQMQTAPLPVAALRTEGSKIYLGDGRVLIDGIASWWTACHGYNHPHIREAGFATAWVHAACDVRVVWRMSRPTGWRHGWLI